MVIVTGLIDPLNNCCAFGNTVRSIVSIDIVGIEPQTDAREGVCLQIEVTNRERLGNADAALYGVPAWLAVIVAEPAERILMVRPSLCTSATSCRNW